MPTFTEEAAMVIKSVDESLQNLVDVHQNLVFVPRQQKCERISERHKFVSDSLLCQRSWKSISKRCTKRNLVRTI
jgi:hypothetical protein